MVDDIASQRCFGIADGIVYCLCHIITVACIDAAHVDAPALQQVDFVLSCQEVDLLRCSNKENKS